MVVLPGQPSDRGAVGERLAGAGRRPLDDPSITGLLRAPLAEPAAPVLDRPLPCGFASSGDAFVGPFPEGPWPAADDEVVDGLLLRDPPHVDGTPRQPQYLHVGAGPP